MIIFVDESGIHKQTGHSTFALVEVTFDEKDTVERGVLLAEERHKIRSFHWSQLP